MSYAWERYDGPEIPDGVELHESIARACLPDLESVTEFEPFIQWLCTPVTGENVFIAGRLAVINDVARLREVQGIVNELDMLRSLGVDPSKRHYYDDDENDARAAAALASPPTTSVVVSSCPSCACELAPIPGMNNCYRCGSTLF